MHTFPPFFFHSVDPSTLISHPLPLFPANHTHTSARLANDGKYKVRAVGRSEVKLREVLALDDSQIEYAQADSRDPDSLQGPLGDADAVVIATGTSAFPSPRWKGGNTPDAVDRKGVANILKALTAKPRRRPVKKVGGWGLGLPVWRGACLFWLKGMDGCLSAYHTNTMPTIRSSSSPPSGCSGRGSCPSTSSTFAGCWTRSGTRRSCSRGAVGHCGGDWMGGVSVCLIVRALCARLCCLA